MNLELQRGPKVCDAHDTVVKLQFLKDGSLLVVDLDAHLVVVNPDDPETYYEQPLSDEVEDLQLRRVPGYEEIWSASVHPGGEVVAFEGAGELQVFSFPQLESLVRLAPPARYMGVRFSPCGRWLATTTEWEVMVWEWQSAKLLTRTHRGERNYGVCWHPSEPVFLSLEASGRSVIGAWRVDESSVELLRELPVDTDELRGAEFALSGTTVLVNDSYMLRQYRFPELEPLAGFDVGGIPHDPVVSSDGRFLASGNKKGMLGIWDAANGTRLWEACDQYADAMTFVPEGRGLVIADGNAVYLWTEVGN